MSPVKKLLKIITSLVDEHGLVPGQYSGAHMRAKYPAEGMKKSNITLTGGNEKGKGEVNMNDNKTYDLVTSITDNAINCAVEAMNETKFVYFASDSHQALEYSVRKKRSRIKVITRHNNTVNSIHFDGDNEGNLHNTYPTIVDVWMLSHAKCISQGMGGFGHFASMLGGNHHTCRVRHRNYKNATLPCILSAGTVVRPNAAPFDYP